MFCTLIFINISQYTRKFNENKLQKNILSSFDLYWGSPTPALEPRPDAGGASQLISTNVNNLFQLSMFTLVLLQYQHHTFILKSFLQCVGRVFGYFRIFTWERLQFSPNENLRWRERIQIVWFRSDVS